MAGKSIAAACAARARVSGRIAQAYPIGDGGLSYALCRRQTMRRFRGSLAAAAIASAFGMAAATMAQTPTEPVVDHIHLSVPDQAKAVEWYQKYFAGQAMKEAPDRLMLGDTRLIFLKSDKAQPS